jgi:hypothetical protein
VGGRRAGRSGAIFLIFRLVKIAWPNSMMGLLPAVFALPGLLSLITVVLKKIPAENKSRMTTRVVSAAWRCFSSR